MDQSQKSADRKIANRQIAEEMLQFIENSPSAFHTVASGKQLLKQAGYQELEENCVWYPEAGGKYFVVRNDSSMIALHIPEDISRIRGFHMVATHSDSPTFKVKEAPEIKVEDRYVKLNTEKYGGMILSTWMDRVLSVAGRIAVETEAGSIVTKLVNIDEDLLVIPNLAIHMNRDMNKGVEYNPQVDMLPLFAGGEEENCKGMLMQKVASDAGVIPEEILGHDLVLYPREKGRIVGAAGEFVCSPRLDDLQCTFAALQAFVTSTPTEYINVCAVFDNEEVGSGTGQGADSTFLEDTLWRVCEGLEAAGRTAKGLEEAAGGRSAKGSETADSSMQKKGPDLFMSKWLRWIAGSFLISADNAHAVHPNHPEKADPTNRPYLNGGIVIKYHGSQKYTTDAVSAAKMKSLCRKAEVPFQTYTNRSDVVGGSTLGNISTAHVSVSSVDIGLPQLAMHSAVETAGVKDTAYAVRVFETFWAE